MEINKTTNGTPHIQTPNTSDALIINSNSNVVSEEIIFQLQEQFGDSKQIYILNTSSANATTATAAANASGGSSADGGTIQYLVVDKGVDINLLLQDPSVFQAATSTTPPPAQQAVTANHTASSQPAPLASTNNNHHKHVPSLSVGSRSSGSQSQPQLSHQNDNEESIVRVSEPPPKRKKIEYQPSDPTGNPKSYQEAFIRYLASCGDRSSQQMCNIDSSSGRKMPRDRIYQNFFQNSPLASSKTSPGAVTVSASGQQQMNGSSSTAPAHIGKENYYNSSRRENLTPLNSCEYRNSYKDVYDNQGVRVNPAIIKSLAAASAATSSSATSSFVPAPTTQLTPPKSSINITKNPTPTKVDDVGVQQSGSNPNILSDHTYRTVTGQQGKNKAVGLGDVSKTDSPLNHKINESVNFNPNSLEAVDQTPTINSMETETTTTTDPVTFTPGEFLIHKPTFSGDFNSYDIWCVLDHVYLQKYEPVLLLTGERCHQSVDLLAQYTANKDDFLVVKVEEKGKTENDNLVVAVLADFEPKNNEKMAAALAAAASTQIAGPI